MQNDTAILVTSFGTSHTDALLGCIAATESAVRERFPKHPVYRAFTSGMVIKKLAREHELHVDTVTQALERMTKDGVKHAVVLPTLIIPGIEYERIMESVSQYARLGCAVAKPLLCERSDCEALARVILAEYPLESDEALVLMGHGTPHGANAMYGEMQSVFDESGAPVYITTVEGTPRFSDTVTALRKRGVAKAKLLPFLFVAGEHAKVDMAGEGSESLASLLRNAGIEPIPITRGLGELAPVRAFYAGRVEEALRTFAVTEGTGEHV